MWAVCILAWCLFVACLCSALWLEEKIIAEVEQGIPIDQRPSVTSLNGRAVASAARKQHAAMFPQSKLRLANSAVWFASGLTLIGTLTLMSRVFGF